jgi:hypothetical protein
VVGTKTHESLAVLKSIVVNSSFKGIAWTLLNSATLSSTASSTAGV